MIDAILSTVGGILSYFLGSFGTAQFFDNPGLEADFGAWKVLFAFVAAGSVFLSQSFRGLVVVFHIVRLVAKLKDVFPKKEDDSGEPSS
jgi:hypothetical protein